MRKIWAVSSGEYSDYRVEAMFETKELAEEVAKLDAFEVEEYTVYDAVPSKVGQHIIYVSQKTSAWSMGDDPATVAVDGGWFILERHFERWPWDYAPADTRPRLSATYMHDTHRGRWAFFYEGPNVDTVRRAVYDKIREMDERARLLDMAAAAGVHTKNEALAHMQDPHP